MVSLLPVLPQKLLELWHIHLMMTTEYWKSQTTGQSESLPTLHMYSYWEMRSLQWLRHQVNVVEMVVLAVVRKWTFTPSSLYDLKGLKE